MTCRDVADFLLDYVAGELPETVRAPFEDHLARCANCREFLKEYRMTIAAGPAAFEADDVTVPSELVDAIMRSLRL